MKFALVIKTKSESHYPNDEISNPLNLSGTTCEGRVQKHRTFVSQNFTSMLFIATVLH